MSAMDDPTTIGRTRLSFATEADIEEFVATLERFERGELTPDQWRAFRLVRGTYGQRQTGDAHMLRVKIPEGILTATQIEALADVGERYSRGFGHITTRQNVQFHFMKLCDVELALRRLAEAGLTTREACGNSVRNITCCPYAGVSVNEVFDVTPFAETLTRYFLRHPLSASLPRKFKIAFEGCRIDHALTSMHDIGWRAVMQGAGAAAQPGFRVTVGGGTAIMCASGQLLYDFLPAGDMLNVAEAIVRVFHRCGDYTHKQANRMKFLIKSLGWERWREAFERELDGFRAEGGARLPFDPERPPEEDAPAWPRTDAPSMLEAMSRATASKVAGPGILPEICPSLSVTDHECAHWASTNVRPQKQAGCSIVTVTIPLGDVTGQQLRVLSDLARAYGDGAVRLTAAQNLLFRWVRNPDVVELFRRLCAAGLGRPDADTIADVTSCPGAESCKLAVTQSRGLGKTLGDYLRERPDLVAAAPDLSIKISGCPNGCGRHHVAGLGFQGSVRRVGAKAVPQYFILVGGGLAGSGIQFGRLAAKVPVHRLREALERLIHLYHTDRHEGEAATAFFMRVNVGRVKQVLGDLVQLSPDQVSPEDCIDLGEETPFSPKIQAGECSA